MKPGPAERGEPVAAAAGAPSAPVRGVMPLEPLIVLTPAEVVTPLVPAVMFSFHQTRAVTPGVEAAWRVTMRGVNPQNTLEAVEVPSQVHLAVRMPLTSSTLTLVMVETAI